MRLNVQFAENERHSTLERFFLSCPNLHLYNLEVYLILNPLLKKVMKAIFHTHVQFHGRCISKYIMEVIVEQGIL